MRSPGVGGGGPPAYGGNRMAGQYPASNRHSTRYNSAHTINEGFSTMGGGSRSLQRHSNFFSTSCDPLKLLGKPYKFKTCTFSWEKA